MKPVAFLALAAGLASLGAQGLRVPFATGEYSPYCSASLPGYGSAVELVEAACRAAGIESEYDFLPWKRAEIELAEGAYFAAFPYGITPERGLRFDFSEPLYYVTNALVYFDRNPATRAAPPFEVLEDLRPLRVGHIIGSFMEVPLARAGVTAVKTAELDQLARMLHEGRIDLIAEDETSICDAIARLYPEHLQDFHSLDRHLDERRPNCLMVSRTWPGAAAMLARFNEGLRRIKASGEYDRIVARNHLGK